MKLKVEAMTLDPESLEQSERLASMLEKQKRTVLEFARAVQVKDVQYVFLAIHGMLDNAGGYVNSLWRTCS